MKHTIFVVLLTFICGCSGNKAIKNGARIPEIYTLKSSAKVSIENGIVFFDKKQYDGFLYELRPNSTDTASVEGFLNGALHGTCKKWYPDGQLAEERVYIQGEKNGKQVSYWENGLKRFEFTAKNDTYEGELKEWNTSGKLIHLANYVNGQEEGIQKMWYDNGKIRANYVILDGKRYGLLGTKNCINVSDSVFIDK